MTTEEAERLAQFVKDHDKRYEAKAMTAGEQSAVLLTSAVDGVPLEPIVQIDQYRIQQIEENDPGPSVRAAWEIWAPGAGHGK